MDNFSNRKHQPQPEFRNTDVLYKHKQNRKQSEGEKTSFFGIPKTGGGTDELTAFSRPRTDSIESTNSILSGTTDSGNNSRKGSFVSQIFGGLMKRSFDEGVTNERKVSLDDYMKIRNKESINGDGFSKQDYMTKNLINNLKIGKPKF
uniref:Uncharacterized protein n=1 Tax=Parastrongyloides trichosuri TaxID=131310 RepID=A0A0N4Z4G7_PARTI